MGKTPESKERQGVTVYVGTPDKNGLCTAYSEYMLPIIIDSKTIKGCQVLKYDSQSQELIVMLHNPDKLLVGEKRFLISDLEKHCPIHITSSAEAGILMRKLLNHPVVPTITLSVVLALWMLFALRGSYAPSNNQPDHKPTDAEASIVTHAQREFIATEE